MTEGRAGERAGGRAEPAGHESLLGSVQRPVILRRGLPFRPPARLPAIAY
jgi:hypothetical protein